MLRRGRTSGGTPKLISRSGPSGGTGYTYDAFGNLRTVLLPDSTQIGYIADPQGRRVQKSINGSPTRQWLYDGDLNIAAELDGNGSLVSHFVYASRGNVPDLVIQGGVVHRLVVDQLGSLRLVVRISDGVVVQRMDYDEHGVVTNDIVDPSFVRVPFGFAGGHYDPHTNLVRFGARDYDASIGRWTAKDPALFAGGQSNLYAYSHSDPVNYLDVDGRHPIVAALIAGGFVFFATNDRDAYMAAGFAFAGPIFGKVAGAALGRILSAIGRKGAVVSGSGLSRACGARAKIAPTPKLCFAGGTLVETRDGLRPIEEVEVGTLVWARDEVSGEEGWQPVTKAFVTHSKDVLRLGLSGAGDEQVLHVTPEHPLWSLSRQDWVVAGELRLGETVESRRGPLAVVSLQSSSQLVTVYNFTVREAHSYFVGEAGVWAHNTPDKWRLLADLKYSSYDALGAIEQRKAQAYVDRFQQRYLAGVGEKMQNIRNLNNLGNGVWEIKEKKSGVRVYLDSKGNVLAYSNKNNQAKTIKRLMALMRRC